MTDSLPPSADERPHTLWIARRPPDRKGPPESRSAWRMLSRTAVESRPHVMVEDGHDEQDMRGRLRTEIASRHFDAIFVVGDESVRRWLPWARRTAPSSSVVAVLTGEDSLAGPQGPGASSRRLLLEETRRALAQAHRVWCADGATLRATRAVLRGVPAPEPSLAAPGTARPRPSAPLLDARVEAISLGGADAGRIEATLELRAPGRSPVHRVKAGRNVTLAELNAALFSARAPFLWLCLDAFATPDASLLDVLTQGLAERPYAGGATPLPRPLPAGRSAAAFRAAWSISRKGDWHEAGFRAHACCLLLRRDALHAVGKLDERLLGVDAALIDLSLRLAMAGRPIFEARDALVRCPAGSPGIAPADRETLAGKWGAGALRLLESLVTALEPGDYRIDATVKAGFRGTA